MSKRRTRKFQRDLILYARELGARDVEIVPGGKHPRIEGTYQGKRFSVLVAAGEPKEYHAPESARRNMRKALGIEERAR